MVSPFYELRNAEVACEKVVQASLQKWYTISFLRVLRKKEDDAVDDITCLIVFLDVAQ